MDFRVGMGTNLAPTTYTLLLSLLFKAKQFCKDRTYFSFLLTCLSYLNKTRFSLVLSFKYMKFHKLVKIWGKKKSEYYPCPAFRNNTQRDIFVTKENRAKFSPNGWYSIINFESNFLFKKLYRVRCNICLQKECYVANKNWNILTNGHLPNAELP